MIFYFLYFLITPLFYIVIHIGKFFSKKIYFHIVNEKQLLLNVKNAIKTKNNNKKIMLTINTNCKFCSFNSIKLLSINVKNVIKERNKVRRNIIIINKFLFMNASINYEYI